MIDALKAKLWSLLQEKEVSLAMLCDRSGAILWHRGRTIRGRTVDEGEGFPKSSLRQAIEAGGRLLSSDVVVMSGGDTLPQSARVLYVKSLVVQPIDETFLLYVDSGSKEAFSEADIEVFRVLGELLRDSLATIRRSQTETGGITGSSDTMGRIRHLAIRYALEEEPILLTGETGVGKSHVAELIHRYSGRNGRFVVAHVPSIPESLFESEMFGHARGAFTGAGDRRSGLLHEADGGTLFLDEVSEVPTSFQSKLLSLVESRRYRVLGETQEREANVRVVAASNSDLALEVAAKRFRSDLYFRLSVLPIAIPPLRERVEDIRDLVEHHAALLRGRTPGEGFWEVLLRHPWPGNVRELLHVLRRAGIGSGGPVTGREVSGLLCGYQAGAEGLTGGAQPTDAALAMAEAAIRAGATFWDTAWRGFLKREFNRSELRDMLRRWHGQHGGSLRRLSEALHIPSKDYPRFVAALHKYGVHPGRT